MSVTDEKDLDACGGKALGLDETEMKALDTQAEMLPSSSGYMAIYYSFADRLDVLVMVACAILAIGAGTTMPLMTVCSLVCPPARF